MGRQRLLICCSLLLAITGNLQSVGAKVIVSPSAVIQNTLGERGPLVPITNIIDRSGLSPTFTSGVTDFDDYLAGNPLHSGAYFTDWFAPDGTTTGIIDFDMGRAFAIDRIAVWNENGYGVTGLTVFTSNDPAFSASVQVGSFAVNSYPHCCDTPAEIHALSTTSARYVRLQVLGAYPDDTLPALASLSEVAFSSTTIPNPGDFNEDDIVDAGDYVVWRKSIATLTDYDLWISNFGNATVGTGTGLGMNAPEPSSILLAGAAFSILDIRRRAATIRINL
jgi:hypothetical protein